MRLIWSPWRLLACRRPGPCPLAWEELGPGARTGVGSPGIALCHGETCGYLATLTLQFPHLKTCGNEKKSSTRSKSFARPQRGVRLALPYVLPFPDSFLNRTRRAKSIPGTETVSVLQSRMEIGGFLSEKSYSFHLSLSLSVSVSLGLCLSLSPRTLWKQSR